MILEISKVYTYLNKQKKKIIYYLNFIMVYGKMLYLMEIEYIYGLKKKKTKLHFRIMIMLILKHLWEIQVKENLKKAL